MDDKKGFGANGSGPEETGPCSSCKAISTSRVYQDMRIHYCMSPVFRILVSLNPRNSVSLKPRPGGFISHMCRNFVKSCQSNLHAYVYSPHPSPMARAGHPMHQTPYPNPEVFPTRPGSNTTPSWESLC